MQRSSARERSGGGQSRRAQTEPTTALVAVFAVVLALSSYAVVFDGARRTEERVLADPTLERVSERVSESGVADPNSVGRGQRAAPNGYELNVSLSTSDNSWTTGPPTPDRRGHGARTAQMDTATRRLGVRLRPGVVRPGRLRVVVWR
ncbi:hypothetical protein AUR64_08715 [Haloprofundus marisrubri]|uniref:Uncharacterized protein n=1 Tax=Haloprofundus marisrubri TaxID=1514971 RepID=A0A0W1R8E8_9EURY|nr:hypothetical protein [Haloprofundus marisrubri]KTG09713.1 hypothetical protein AUR64_08715 [Haloprofundus marisrubri]